MMLNHTFHELGVAEKASDLVGWSDSTVCLLTCTCMLHPSTPTCLEFPPPGYIIPLHSCRILQYAVFLSTAVYHL